MISAREERSASRAIARAGVVVLLALATSIATHAREGERLASKKTALDEYVAAPDPTFSWKTVTRRDSEDAVTLLVDLTSQTWRTPAEVDRPLWKHWLWIVVPRQAKGDTALLVISGGSHRERPPEEPSELLQQVAAKTGLVVAEISNVPNQPLEFFHDGQGRVEDDLLTQSWLAALREDDLTWIGQLPMAKAAVRAMDAVQAALAADEALPDVSRFVVAGASKRGWTTWLTAAVDARVVAIAPIVIDMLNMRRSMRNHHAAYGFWAPAIEDYERTGLLADLNGSRMTPLV